MDYYKIATIVLSVIVFYLMLSNWINAKSVNAAFLRVQRVMNKNFDIISKELEELRELGDSTTEQVDILEKELRKSRNGIWRELGQLGDRIDRAEQNLHDRISHKLGKVTL